MIYISWFILGFLSIFILIFILHNKESGFKGILNDFKDMGVVLILCLIVYGYLSFILTIIVFIKQYKYIKFKDTIKPNYERKRKIKTLLKRRFLPF